MSTQPKHPTINFRISNAEHKQIEARIHANDKIKELQTDYNNMLTAIIDLLDDAKYLWEGEHHETKYPVTCLACMNLYRFYYC